MKLKLGLEKDSEYVFVCFSQLVFGLLSVDKKSWVEQLVQGTSSEIRDLIPGSDYGISIQSVLGSDTSQEVYRELSTRKRQTNRKTKA